MNRKKVDRRIVNTRRKLGEALLKLIQEQHISQVTTKALCDEAGVNRGTFYKYYSSPYDVILGIENEVYNGFKKMINQSPLPKNPNVFIFRCLELMEQNADVCRALFVAQEYRLIHRLFELIHQSCLEYWQQEFHITDLKVLDRLYTFISYGVLGVAKRWAVGSYSSDPSDLSDFVNTVTDRGVMGFSDDRHLDKVMKPAHRRKLAEQK
jgi:AcrR family transcriptional regulator